MQKKQSKYYLRLLLLLAINIVLVGYIKLESRIFAEKAFLTKHGDRFVVAYKDRDENVDMLSFATLEQANRYLAEKLRVEIRSSLTSLDFPMEYVWIRKDVGKSVLYWKFEGKEYLNRMTFQNEADALFFEKALKSGAYSPSPVGHSIALRPIAEPSGRTPVVSKLVDSFQAGLSF